MDEGERRWSVSRLLTMSAGLYALVGGGVSLIGWIASIPRLTDWNNDGITIKANTAIAAAASGLGLVFTALREKGIARRALVIVIGAFVALLGGLTLTQHITGWNFGIDTLLFSEPPGALATFSPGRMGVPASTSFLLYGIALICSQRGPLLRAIASAIGAAVVLISALSLTGYLYGAEQTYMLRLTGIALQTASMLFVLGIGIIAGIPDRGPMRTVLEPTAAGLLVRRALPLIVILPIGLGWARVALQNYGLVDTALGSAMRTLLEAILLIGLLWWAAGLLRAYETPLRSTREQLEGVFGSITDAFLTIDSDWRLVFLNDHALRRIGKPLSEVRGRNLWEVFAVAPENIAYQRLQQAMQDRATVEYEMYYPPWQRWFADKAYPTADGGLAVYSQDITDRKAAEALSLDHQRRKAAIIAGALDCVIEMDHKGLIVEFNPAAEATLGFRRADVLGKNMDELIIPPALRPLHREGIARYLATGKSTLLDKRIEVTALRADGTEFPAELTVTRVPGQGLPLFAAFLRDITERKHAEQTLRDADQRKTVFLATLAHELRNPLAPMRNALAILETGRAEAFPLARETLARQIRHMVRLIDDLLDISRITQGKVVLKRSNVALGAIVSDAVESVRPAIDAAGHQLNVNITSDPIELHVDAIRVQQVITNLLSNASKYTDPPGVIVLTVARDGGDAVLTVSDNGVGIPPPMLPKVFEMFTQVDESLEKSQGGLGIGLSLARNFVELHGGTLEAHSAGLGTGSTFTVRLPAAVAEEAKTSKAPPPHEVSPGQENIPRSVRILVVDDNHDSAESMAVLLKIHHYETHLAHDGIDAVEAAERLKPDIILMDIGLPRLNGYDAVRAIRMQPWGKSVAVIALSGWAQDEDRQRATDAGFNSHLTKPVDFDVLISAVNALAPVS